MVAKKLSTFAHDANESSSPNSMLYLRSTYLMWNETKSELILISKVNISIEHSQHTSLSAFIAVPYNLRRDICHIDFLRMMQ